MATLQHQGKFLQPYKCKYCKRFIHDHLQYIKHVSRHEIHIRPYWYKNSQLPPKARSVQIRSLNHRGNKLLKGYVMNLGNKEEMKSKKHSTDGHYKSKFCNESFRVKQTQSVHEMTRYQCNDCVKSFTRLSEKKQHEIMTHKKEKLHQCSYCVNSFTSLANKKQHELTHTGEKPHQCGYCVKSFTYISTNKQHELTHTGEKSHQCSYCVKVCRSLSSKKQHELTHTGEKPHRCGYCVKSFTRISTKKLHEMTHTGEKPH